MAKRSDKARAIELLKKEAAYCVIGEYPKVVMTMLPESLSKEVGGKRGVVLIAELESE